MSITAECNACGRKYQAPASLAGKRVRCKQCGNIFSLPETEGGPADGQPDLDALAKMEQSFHSMDATAHGSAGAQEGEDEGYDSPGALRSARMNVRFSFPMAKELDQWLPLVFTVVGLFLLFRNGYKLQAASDERLKPWIAAFRVGIAFAAFVALIAPMTLAAIRAAGRRLDYRMPSSDRFRAFAAFMPAFAFTYMMWCNGGGDIPTLILGAITGLIIAMIGVWFFFRLNPMEIAPTAGYAAAGYLTGIALTAVIFLGLNFVLQQGLLGAKRPDLVPQSLFASSMPWFTEEQLKQVAAQNEPIATTKAAPTTEASGTEAPDTGLSTGSPVVKSGKAAPISGPFDTVLFPMVNSKFAAVIRTGAQVTVESFDTEIWTAIGQKVSFLPEAAATGPRFAITPDGEQLATISKFPQLSAQIKSFKDASKPPVLLYLENRPNMSTDPELVGFTSPNHLLTRWKAPGGFAFEMIDISSRQQVYRMVTPAYEPTGYPMVVSRDGKLAAIATKIQNPSTRLVKPTLLFYNLETGKQLDNTTEITLDAQWPVTPTGMAFSNDSKKLAILFEQSGNALMLAYELDPATGQARRVAEYVFPAGPLPGRDLRSFNGNALAWLPGDTAWLVYGQGLFSVATGQPLPELGLPGVERYRINLPSTLLIVGPWPPETRQISSLQLDLAAINPQPGAR